jgi:predicted choloylglycine hydrolase
MQNEQTPPATAFRYPEGRCGKGELTYREGLPVLTVEGSPEDMGEAIGALGVRVAPQMADYPEDLLRAYCVYWLHGYLTRAGEEMVRRLPLEYQRELDAMVRGAGIERHKVVLGNTLFDQKKILACSALLVEGQRSATGGPLMGRNLDYPSMGYAHEYALVTVYRPGEPTARGRPRHAFATVGFPGLLGCLSGMNDAGLSLAVLEVPQAGLFTRRLDRSGTPYALCLRRLLEECTTIDEAREALRGMRRTTMINLVLADRQRVAALEITTRRVLERPPQEGACVCTNHFSSEELRPWWQFNHYQTLDRYRTLQKATRTRWRFDLDDLHRSMHAVSHPEETLQTMIFEPASLRLHLAIGTCPASAGELRTLNLEPLFQESLSDRNRRTHQ